MRTSFLVFLSVLIAAPTTHCLAQGVTPSDPGLQEFNRQQERERILREQQDRRPDIRPDIRLERPEAQPIAERLPLNELPCLHIDAIVLAGDAALKWPTLLRPADMAGDGTQDVATGRCLGTASINLVMKRLQSALFSQGYVTSRVLVSPQDLSVGVLTLTVIPGRVRRIRFAGDTATRATLWNAVPVRPGDVLNIKDIEQALENFRRVPGVEADIQITPTDDDGGTPSESDIVISWQQRLPFRLNLSADNAGSPTTGKLQGTLTLSYDHWWTLNDLFYISFHHDLGKGDPGARGTQGQTMHYAVPYGYWLLGLTASSNHYW